MGIIFGNERKIGLALLLSTSVKAISTERWSAFRLFLMQFSVSSYLALIKGKGFFLIFPSMLGENAIGVSCLLVFLASQRTLERSS